MLLPLAAAPALVLFLVILDEAPLPSHAARTRANRASRTRARSAWPFVPWYPHASLSAGGSSVPMETLPEKRLAYVAWQLLGRPRLFPHENPKMNHAATEMACSHLKAYANEFIRNEKLQILPDTCHPQRIQWINYEYKWSTVTALFASSNGNRKVCCTTTIKPDRNYVPLCSWTKCYAAVGGIEYEKYDKTTQCHEPDANYTDLPRNGFRRCLKRNYRAPQH